MKKKFLLVLTLSLMCTMPVQAKENDTKNQATTEATTEDNETEEIISNIKNIDETIIENIDNTKPEKNILITNDIIVPNTENFINIKEEPSSNSKSIAKLYDGSAATLVDYVDDDWIKVESGNIIGYVMLKDVISTENTQEYIEENIDSYEKEIYSNNVEPIPVYKEKKNVGSKVEYEFNSFIDSTTVVYSQESLESEAYEEIRDCEVEVLSINKNWAQIKYDNKTGFVKASNINYDYTLPEDSKAISLIFPGKKYTLEENEDGILKIDDGYIKDEDITITVSFNDAEVISDSAIIDVGGIPEGWQKDLVEYAVQFVGNPYVWGGESLTEGCDCSGFTMLIYANYGVSLPHNAQTQYDYGTKVALEDVQPGDLIFYGNSEYDIEHVGIYIGNNQLLHASNPSSGIKISEWFYRTPVGAVRLK